jgi:glutathione S-transferase
MNLKAHHENFRIFTGAKPDIQRIETIWSECLRDYGGPFLFGARPTVADAMFAPVTRRFMSYNVALDAINAAYCQTVSDWPPMIEWTKAALEEPEELEELDIEF